MCRTRRGRLRTVAVSPVARWNFELYRFDMVRYVNQLDSEKVLLLETGINNTFYGETRRSDADPQPNPVRPPHSHLTKTLLHFLFSPSEQTIP